jgi:hypothetical protein
MRTASALDQPIRLEVFRFRKWHEPNRLVAGEIAALEASLGTKHGQTSFRSVSLPA